MLYGNNIQQSTRRIDVSSSRQLPNPVTTVQLLLVWSDLMGRSGTAQAPPMKPFNKNPRSQHVKRD
uniref:Uncharacterized protein n=1 Tax=Romanomermis culicivorax TaxID=13658 RepID=A0A915HJ36_ROMCU